MSSTTFFKALTFGLVVMSLCNVCLSDETPMTSLSNLWEKIKNETTSVQVNEVAITAGARPENRTNDLNPINTSTDSENLEKKESWVIKYLIVVAGVVVGLFILVVTFLFIMKTIKRRQRNQNEEAIEMDPIGAECSKQTNFKNQL